MATQKRKTSLQDALRGDFAKKGYAELKSDLEGLFDTLSGYELVDAVYRACAALCGRGIMVRR